MAALKILYIACFFPPLGGVASLRSLKNVKYLTQLGHQVQVLTARTALVRRPKDQALLSDLPTSVKIWRAFYPDISWLYKLLWGLRLNALVRFFQQRLLIPDDAVLWRPFAQGMLHRIMRHNQDIRVAVISSGPPSSLSLGLILKHRYGIPFICDFRDEWTNSPERINLHYPPTSQNRELVMEARILSAAAGIAYLSQLMRDNFCRRLPLLEGKPSAIISNGFDDSDFAGLTASSELEVFRLVYSGSFYDRRQPEPLWQAILGLLSEGGLDPEKFRVEITGRNTRSFVLGKYTTDPRLKKIVSFSPFLPYADSLKKQMAATALLLFIPSGKNTESVLTGKIFDYLRSEKPILAIVPPQGLAAELVLKAGTGLVADYQDIAGIANNLQKLYDLWQSGRLSELQPDRAYIRQFSRKEQAARLAKLIEEVIE